MSESLKNLKIRQLALSVSVVPDSTDHPIFIAHRTGCNNLEGQGICQMLMTRRYTVKDLKVRGMWRLLMGLLLLCAENFLIGVAVGEQLEQGVISFATITQFVPLLIASVIVFGLLAYVVITEVDKHR